MAPTFVSGQSVAFSRTGGFYADTFSLALTATDAPTGSSIRYTLNGSLPTATSDIYTAPLALSASCYSRSEIFRIQNAPQQFWYSPDSVEHIIVVRAAVFDTDGNRLSEVGTQSYLVGSLMGRAIDLPIVLLCVDSADLFDYDSGIFVPGRHFEPDSPNSHRTGNYYMRGEEWERNVHFTYIVDGVQRLNQNCGIRMHGISQRNKPQKAMTLYAREEYGKKKFACRFFPERNADKYKRLVLRSLQATQPYTSDGIHDWLCQQLAEPLRCDNLASRPVVLFLNGEYWGIYFMEEKPDEHYIECVYGIDDEDVTIINWWSDAENGDQNRWDAFYSHVAEIDASNPVDSAWLASEVDIDALIDYMLLELFVTNMDWPANNARCWSAPGQRWRCIFFDGDYTLDDRWFDRYSNLMCDDTLQTYPSSAQSTLLMRRLLGNKGWRRQSAERLRQLLVGPLSYRRASMLLDNIRAAIEPELAYQMARFDYPASVTVWKEDLQIIDDYLLRNSYSMKAEYLAFLGDTEMSNSPKMMVIPNPSTSNAVLWVQCESEKGYWLTVCDFNGRIVHSSYHWLRKGINTVHLPNVMPGKYLVTINDIKAATKWVVVSSAGG